ncbi:MAG: response regulator, partial [Methylocystaceae bacterium]|nr:response regulator [Methylocystaceae bacterium]
MMNTIYLIDDERDILKSVGLFLQDEGYQIKSFERAADFKASLPLVPSAIILADMQMPKGTGLDLQNFLIDEKIDVPILFMSG